MTLEQFIGFSVFAFVACVTPGPNNLLLTAVGGSRGIRRGLPTLMGVAFGFALMLFLAAIGVGRTCGARRAAVRSKSSTFSSIPSGEPVRCSQARWQDP